MSYCCSKDTADRGICENDKIGTMMIDHNTFEGDHRTIAVPNKPLTDFDMDEPLFDVEKTGDYVMVIANCDDDGFGIITLGNMEWKSVGGYLVSDMVVSYYIRRQHNNKLVHMECLLYTHILCSSTHFGHSFAARRHVWLDVVLWCYDSCLSCYSTLVLLWHEDIPGRRDSHSKVYFRNNCPWLSCNGISRNRLTHLEYNWNEKPSCDVH